MPPSTSGETLRADDLTVTMRAGAFIAVTVLPIICIQGLPEHPQTLAVATALLAAAHGGHVVYRRVRGSRT
ncbi:hypothetical protein [Streptomyces sp. NPDC048606]|uniref:hypothetical protein n=1 Tax=Streptomyces sp. NPDC048606 TaxID=3154726 RepID=UPI0034489F2A